MLTSSLVAPPTSYKMSSPIIRVPKDDIEFMQSLCARLRRSTTYLDRIALIGAIDGQLDRILRMPTVIDGPPSPTQHLPFGTTEEDIMQNNYMPTPPVLQRTASQAPPALRRTIRRLRIDTGEEADDEETEVVEPPEEAYAAAAAAAAAPPGDEHPRRRRRLADMD